MNRGLAYLLLIAASQNRKNAGLIIARKLSQAERIELLRVVARLEAWIMQADVESETPVTSFSREPING